MQFYALLTVISISFAVAAPVTNEARAVPVPVDRFDVNHVHRVVGEDDRRVKVVPVAKVVPVKVVDKRAKVVPVGKVVPVKVVDKRAKVVPVEVVDKRAKVVPVGKVVPVKVVDKRAKVVPVGKVVPVKVVDKRSADDN